MEVDNVEWITVRGSHIPIEKGKNKQEAISKHFESLSKAKKTKSLNDLAVKTSGDKSILNLIISNDGIQEYGSLDELDNDFLSRNDLYVHGRSRGMDLGGGMVLITQNMDTARQYGRDGSIHFFKQPSQQKIMTLSHSSKDMDRVVKQALKDEMFVDRIEVIDEETGQPKDTEDLTSEEIAEGIENIVRDSFAPQDIVDSGGAFDSPEMYSWFENCFGHYDFAETPDGGVVLNPDNIKSAAMEYKEGHEIFKEGKKEKKEKKEPSKSINKIYVGGSINKSFDVTHLSKEKLERFDLLSAFMSDGNATNEEKREWESMIKKSNIKKNASQMPKVYYCRHIEKGVVGYEDEMVLINDDALNKLDKTMAGVPVRVHHVDDIDVTNIQEQSDGYVAESFYLECDGWHWAKFICVSDECHQKIQAGWSVSNAYTPTVWGGNGVYHNIPYDREITDGKYGHLAIVPNPRYEGACIMTPEEFKEYKESKEKELKELQNTKKEKKVMLKLFKKVAVEKEIDENALVQLENGKEMSIKDMVTAIVKNESDDKDKEEKMNMDSEIEVGDEKMTVKELVNRYNKMNKKNQTDEEKEKERLANMSDEEKAAEEKKNEEEADEKKKKDEEKEEEKKNALKLKDADLQNANDVIVETSDDKLSRGAERYGSAKI